MPNGGQVVMTTMGATAAIFLGLSGYALTSRKAFSFMGGFLMVGILVAFLASVEEAGAPAVSAYLNLEDGETGWRETLSARASCGAFSRETTTLISRRHWQRSRAGWSPNC
jgi:hypothetical protein